MQERHELFRFYRCACGRSFDIKKRKWFAGRCQYCGSKAKYLCTTRSFAETSYSGDQHTLEHDPVVTGLDTTRTRSNRRNQDRVADNSRAPLSNSMHQNSARRRSSSDDNLYCRKLPVGPPPRYDTNSCTNSSLRLPGSPPPPYSDRQNSYYADGMIGSSGQHRGQYTQSPSSYQDPRRGDLSIGRNVRDEPSSWSSTGDTHSRSTRSYRRSQTPSSSHIPSLERTRSEGSMLRSQQCSSSRYVLNGVCYCDECLERRRRDEMYRNMNEDYALPMTTPFLMQEVLSDGLAMCAIM